MLLILLGLETDAACRAMGQEGERFRHRIANNSQGLPTMSSGQEYAPTNKRVTSTMADSGDSEFLFPRHETNACIRQTLPSHLRQVAPEQQPIVNRESAGREMIARGRRNGRGHGTASCPTGHNRGPDYPPTVTRQHNVMLNNNEACAEPADASGVKVGRRLTQTPSKRA